LFEQSKNVSLARKERQFFAFTFSRDPRDAKEWR